MSAFGFEIPLDERVERPDEALFLDVWPHHKVPISQDAFDFLAVLISEVNEKLEIEDYREHFIRSLGFDGEPTIDASLYDVDEDMSSVIGLSFTASDMAQAALTARSVAGTRQKPRSAAASLGIRDPSGKVTFSIPSIPETTFDEIAEVFEERCYENRFFKVSTDSLVSPLLLY